MQYILFCSLVSFFKTDVRYFCFLVEKQVSELFIIGCTKVNNSVKCDFKEKIKEKYQKYVKALIVSNHVCS